MSESEASCGEEDDNSSPAMVSSSSEDEEECEQWDVTCKVIPRVECQKPICGYHLMPTCCPDLEYEQSAKKAKLSIELEESLVNKNVIEEFKHCWNNNEVMRKPGKNLMLCTYPFKVGMINNFLKDTEFLDRVREEFNEIEWNKRSLDLYEFFQSMDLKHVNLKHIREMYDFLRVDVMPWVANLTGLELTHISATCSFYGNTDYLLVHDDHQDDRLVAFILYLTGPRNWSHSYGGALEMLNTDEEGNPNQVSLTHHPNNNTFVFFQVTNDSFHRVAEVCNKDDCRTTINGWFHTPVAPVFDTPIKCSPLASGLFGSMCITPLKTDIDLESWVNADYLLPDLAHNVQQIMEEQSEIALENYFKSEAIGNIVQDLKSESTEWISVGPPNRYCYQIVNENNLSQILSRFLNLFKSKQMFELLKKYTDLDLTSMKYELQKWTPNCYSLLTDYDWSKTKELDVIIYLNCPEPKQIVGGNVMYVSSDEEIQQSLVTLNPKENVLNIVYRDTARIVKYVSYRSAIDCYYLLICSYKE